MKRLGMRYSTLTRLDYRNNCSTKPVVIKIGDEEKHYFVVSESMYQGSPFDYSHPHLDAMIYEYELQEIINISSPSKEEIAAEESVAKAKEALKAAENALKVIKEQKK